MTTWGDVVAANPELAAFVADRLRAAPCYLATVRASGAPRVHPVTPILTDAGLYVFMEPASPKGTDLRERASFALHNGVPDNSGTGGEASVAGTGHLVDDDCGRQPVHHVDVGTGQRRHEPLHERGVGLVDQPLRFRGDRAEHERALARS